MKTEHEEIMDLANKFFNDMDKTAVWMTTENRMIGGIPPAKMIDIGRGAEVKRWVTGLVDKVAAGLVQSMKP